jgi:hypothetical protein
MTEKPQSPPEFPDAEIDIFLRDRVCSRCYGDLSKRPADKRLWQAFCPTCGEAWGFTTIARSYAEKLGQRAMVELSEVRTNLPDLFPNPHKGKTDKQILAELGF